MTPTPATLEQRRLELRRLWLEGAGLRDIEAVLGISNAGWEMSRMRSEGYDLPYHRERMRRLLDNWPGDARP
jgi:hypothetical protein